MTTTSPSITRRIAGERVRRVLSDKGGTRSYSSPYELPQDVEFDRWHSVAFVRAFAAHLRAGGDYRDNWGTFPVEPVAAGLEALADEVDGGPVDDDDFPNLTAEHEVLIRAVEQRIRARSPLFEEPARRLDALLDPHLALVRHARYVLSVLADIDAILPGVDAELRPVLSLYAGEPS